MYLITISGGFTPTSVQHPCVTTFHHGMLLTWLFGRSLWPKTFANEFTAILVDAKRHRLLLGARGCLKIFLASVLLRNLGFRMQTEDYRGTII